MARRHIIRGSRLASGGAEFWSPGEFHGCSACDFETDSYLMAKGHTRASRSIWQTLGDGSLLAIGGALLIGIPVFVFVQFAIAADRHQREVSLTPSPAFNGPIVDVGGSDPGMPPGVAFDIEQEQRVEAAQRFCEDNNHAGSVEDCVAGVMEGSIELPAPEPTRGYDPGPP